MSEELKACPYCGKPILQSNVLAWCECRPVSAFIKNAETVKIWNTRPIEDELNRKNERMKAMLLKAQDLFIFYAERENDEFTKTSDEICDLLGLPHERR